MSSLSRGAWHMQSAHRAPRSPLSCLARRQSLAFRVNIDRRRGQVVGVGYDSRAGVPTVVQRELLVPVSSFMQLLILALDKVPLYLDVVVTIGFTITRITQVTFPGNQFAEAIETAALEVEEKEHLCPNQRSVALPPKPSPDAPSKRPPGRMRQLKGKPKKETSKDKKERKQAMQEARQQITTVVLPTLAVVVLLIVVFVYVATRPTVTE
nr:single-pass membrane and coiled-coil domain-containing protein 4 isoform X2 [Camelus dromedarius]